MLQSTHLLPPACFTGQTQEIIGNERSKKRLVLIYHDESSLHVKKGESWHWAAEEDK